MIDAFSDFWRDVLDFLHPYPYLQAILIVVASLVLAVLVDRLITGIITRIVVRTETKLDDRLVAIMHRPIFTTVALIGLILATYRLDFNAALQLTTIGVINTLLVLIWLTFFATLETQVSISTYCAGSSGRPIVGWWRTN